MTMDVKPKKAPPAKFANKPTGDQQSVDDVPIRPASNFDDMPIGGKVAAKIEGNPGDIEDKPLPKGTYNLD